MLTVPSGNNYIAIAEGINHACALKSDHTVTCWGDDSYHQLDAPAGTYTAIAAGRYHSCAVKTDGSLVCWGDPSGVVAPSGNDFGTLANVPLPAINALLSFAAGAGQATRGTDYVLKYSDGTPFTANTLPFDEGVQAITLTLVPLSDTVYAEGDETATVTIADDSTYSHTPPSDTAAITIHDSAATAPPDVEGKSCLGTANGTTCMLGVSPGRVKAGNATTLSWNVPSLSGASCSLSAIPGVNASPTAIPVSSATGATGWSGSTNATINSQTIFTLSCTGTDGTVKSVSQTVGLVPTVQEI
jgi:hypothetical protein